MAVSMTLDPKVEHHSLPLEIHTATRALHLSLNRCITSRLPLCLPPNATNPAVYANGIATLGRIYLSFEQAWEDILACKTEQPRIQEVVNQLKLPSLSRSARLKADLYLLDKRFAGQNGTNNEVDTELRILLDRTRKSILNKPYLVLSYAWVMYLALFNGGRWIRAQLEQAGPEFWGMQRLPNSSKIDCLTFWEFEGDLDGEDIKTDFKARYNTAAAALNHTERQDVIDECVKVFEKCSQMVGWLDRQTHTASLEPDVPEAQSWLAASYAAASSAACNIWSGSVRSLTSASFQRPQLEQEPRHYAS